MKKKDFILSVVIGSFLVLLFTILSLTHRFSFSSFGIFGVNAEPAKSYNIRLSLPQANLLSDEVKVASNKKLMKVFNINENAINPVITLTGDAQSKVWNGIFKFEKTPFLIKSINEVSRNEKGAYTSTLLQGDLINPVSNERMLANIYILENGSVIQYVSVTIQKENGDVVSMYTYGKLPPVSTFDDSSSNSMEVAKAGTLTIQATAEQFKILKTQLAYSTLYDPYNRIYPRIVVTQRADAIVNQPFNNIGGATNSLSIRSWAFFTQIENFYKDVYTLFGSSPWAQAGVYKISNEIYNYYNSEIINKKPPESINRTSSLGVSLELVNKIPFVTVNYEIIFPFTGVKIHWSSTDDPSGAPGRNYDNVDIYTAGPDYASTFDKNWRESLEWRGSLSQASSSPSQFVPPSDYKGNFVTMQFTNYSYGSDFRSSFYSNYFYSVRAGNGALWDLYYIGSYCAIPDVRLDQ